MPPMSRFSAETMFAASAPSVDTTQIGADCASRAFLDTRVNKTNRLAKKVTGERKLQRPRRDGGNVCAIGPKSGEKLPAIACHAPLR
jgi:hypothetical protein